MSTAPATPTYPVTAPTAQVVRVLVALKVRILRNGLRHNVARTISLVVGVLAVLAIGGGAIPLAILGRGQPGALGVTTIVLAMTTVSWAITPLFLYASDESSDPTRLTMLPLRPLPLMLGSLAGALVGPGSLLLLLLAVAAAIALATSIGAALVALVAIPVFVVAIVGLSRSVAAANASLLSSRRGRDLATAAGILFVLAGQGANLGIQWVTRTMVDSQGTVDLGPIERAGDVLGWVPPVSAIGAIADAASGRWLTAAARLLLAAAVAAALLLWWQSSLHRLMVVADASTISTESRHRRRRSASGARPGLVLLGEGRARTVAGRSLLYVRRDPRARSALTIMLVMGVVMCGLSFIQGTKGPWPLIIAGALVGLANLNHFGADGSAFWTVVETTSSRAQARAELAGRLLAECLYAIPYLIVLSVGYAALTQDVHTGVVGLALGLCAFGSLAGVGLVLSVLLPYAMPADNAMANAAPGQNGVVFGTMLCAFAGGALVLALPGGLAALTWSSGPTSLASIGTAIFAVLWGIGAAALGIIIAARLMLPRLPELLVRVTER